MARPKRFIRVPIEEYQANVPRETESRSVEFRWVLRKPEGLLNGLMFYVNARQMPCVLQYNVGDGWKDVEIGLED